MNIYFAHGKESGPWGAKITALAEVARGLGCAVESPDFTDSLDPDVRVRKLLSLASATDGPLVLAGSSMGGYVVTVASEVLRPAGLFLMAPAFYLPGYAVQDPQPHAGKTVLVHGWRDNVVPPENAIHFARRHGAELHLLAAGHALAERMEILVKLFRAFLEEVVSSPPPDLPPMRGLLHGIETDVDRDTDRL